MTVGERPPPDNNKKTFAYKRMRAALDGLVQHLDKIVARFALTIYPDSLCGMLRTSTQV